MASIEYPKIMLGEVAVGAGISGFGGGQKGGSRSKLYA